MIGCYDFCGHYEWTFAWLEATGGETLLQDYWAKAIAEDSQRHARELIGREGFRGMEKYWGHTLEEESPDLGFAITARPEVFRIDMLDCPSKGFLLRNHLEQYRDYCDHCIGWIGPMLRDAGFVIDHEHNHRGQCWWELRAASASPTEGAVPAEPYAHDVRRGPNWAATETPVDRFIRATSVKEKQGPAAREV